MAFLCIPGPILYIGLSHSKARDCEESLEGIQSYFKPVLKVGQFFT